MNEEDLLQISALQHALFCMRQYALIHIERLWEENRFTAEGRVLHERVDDVHHEYRRDNIEEYGLAVRSLKYGLVGKCDLVEFEKYRDGSYKNILPIEFKRGRKKADDYDLVQLCAQALCLEEMFRVAIEAGQIYYLQEHRRTSVLIDQALRNKTIGLIGTIVDIRSSGKTPPAEYDKDKCDRCSLREPCMPRSMMRRSSVKRYIKDSMRKMISDE
jgi:CRISPR-associated exonuclease Cas4